MLRSILLIEDNPLDLELAYLALERYVSPLDITVARDGKEALDYLHRRGVFKNREAGNPSLILLDLKLPKIDGIEVLKIIRSTPHLVDIPVVVLSSLGLEPELLRSKALVITGFITKPPNPSALNGVLSRLSLCVAEKVDSQRARPC